MRKMKWISRIKAGYKWAELVVQMKILTESHQKWLVCDFLLFHLCLVADVFRLLECVLYIFF